MFVSLLLHTEISVDLSVESHVYVCSKDFKIQQSEDVTKLRRGWKGPFVIYQDINTNKPFLNIIKQTRSLCGLE